MLLLTTVALTGCGIDDAAPSTETPSLEVRTVLGPAGGTLRGPAGTEWADVLLDVPAGALTESGTVWLRPAFEGAPLAETAERVGVQVEVGSEVPFHAPVRLTVPFDEGPVERAGQEGADVKVWVRAGSAWELFEPVEASGAAVTIELPEPTVVAAGIRLTARTPTCPTCAERVAGQVDPERCGAAGMCLVEMTPTHSPVFGAAVARAPRSELMAWLSPSDGGLRADGFELGASAPHSGASFAPGTSLLANLDVGADGVLRVGLGSLGSARIPLLVGGPPTLTGGVGLGAVTLGNGLSLVLRLVDGRTELLVDGSSVPGTAGLVDNGLVVNHEEGFAPSVRAIPSLVADPTDPDRAFVLSGGALYGFRLAPSDAPSAPVELERLADAPDTPGHAPLAVGRSARGEALVAAVGARGRVLGLVERDGAFGEPVAFAAVSFPALDVAFDGGGRLVVVSSTTPEVAVVDMGSDTLAPPETFALTGAAPDSPTYQGALPRLVIQTDLRVLIRTADLRVFSSESERK